mmetsp:Transcript_52989/g.113688  ORF Transcript_52989/g.113688 Transcript_52989/m.113688 type:complete len:251 (+) Transcript_52989:864-1616(+)
MHVHYNVVAVLLEVVDANTQSLCIDHQELVNAGGWCTFFQLDQNLLFLPFLVVLPHVRRPPKAFLLRKVGQILLLPIVPEAFPRFVLFLGEAELQDKVAIFLLHLPRAEGGSDHVQQVASEIFNLPPSALRAWIGSGDPNLPGGYLHIDVRVLLPKPVDHSRAAHRLVALNATVRHPAGRLCGELVEEKDFVTPSTAWILPVSTQSLHILRVFLRCHLPRRGLGADAGVHRDPRLIHLAQLEKGPALEQN